MTSDNLRTALIAALASLIVAVTSGLFTYVQTKDEVSEQLSAQRDAHAKDIAGAVHDAIDNLLSGKSDRVRTTLAGLYFLGEGTSERKQIVETAGSSGRPELRSAISYVLSMDHEFGSAIASDSDVRQILSSANAPTSPPPHSAPASPTPVDTLSPKTRNDVLDRSVSRLVGTGWIYAGLGPFTKTLSVDADRSITRSGDIKTGDLVTLARAMNFRSGPPLAFGFAPAAGTVNPGDTAVVLSSRAFAFNHDKRAIWIDIYLCDNAATGTAPENTSKCPRIQATN